MSANARLLAVHVVGQQAPRLAASLILYRLEGTPLQACEKILGTTNTVLCYLQTFRSLFCCRKQV